jgi:hypothetical protein
VTLRNAGQRSRSALARVGFEPRRADGQRKCVSGAAAAAFFGKPACKLGDRREVAAPLDVCGSVSLVRAPAREVFPILERAFRTFQPRVPTRRAPSSLLGAALVDGAVRRFGEDVTFLGGVPAIHAPRFCKHRATGLRRELGAGGPKFAQLAFLPMHATREQALNGAIARIEIRVLG